MSYENLIQSIIGAQQGQEQPSNVTVNVNVPSQGLTQDDEGTRVDFRQPDLSPVATGEMETSRSVSPFSSLMQPVQAQARTPRRTAAQRRSDDISPYLRSILGDTGKLF